MDDSSKKGTVKLSFYIDQALSDDTKQDYVCVFSLIDLNVMHIKYNLWFIKSATIQTDNAHNNQNIFLNLFNGIIKCSVQGLYINSALYPYRNTGWAKPCLVYIP